MDKLKPYIDYLDKKLSNKDILDQYSYLKRRFNKAFDCTFEENSKESYLFQAIIIKLSEIENKI